MLATVGYARVHADNGERVNAINPGINCKGPVDQNLKAAIRSSGRNCDEVLAEPLAEIPKSRKAEPEKIDNLRSFSLYPEPATSPARSFPMDVAEMSTL
jgi:NAD(P)-dependent dehydrogenase (short-subunit alcohol dehydrogenase family)